MGGPSRHGILSGVNQDTFTKPIFWARGGEALYPGYSYSAHPTQFCSVSPQPASLYCTSPLGAVIPLPAGTRAAPGIDGHLAIVREDRKADWEMWRCFQPPAGQSPDPADPPCDVANVPANSGPQPSGFNARAITQWDLTGPGYAAGPAGTFQRISSARESGLPLLNTTLTAKEALYGFHHALGISVYNASGLHMYYPPATHANCTGSSRGTGTMVFGQLVLLRPDYEPPPGTPTGWRHVITALKRYGAYIDDDGSTGPPEGGPIFEIDADYNDQATWDRAGFNIEGGSANFTPFTAADFVAVNALDSSVPPGPQHDEGAEPVC
jgi:hypothetical protein